MRHLFAAILLGTSAFAAPRAQADTTVVYVFDFDYSINRPGEGPIVDPIINLGDTIRWVWVADFHTVSSCIGNPEVFDTGIFDTGDTFEQTFNTPGVWWYYCIPHGSDVGDGTAVGMAGTVTVLPAPGVLPVAGAALLALRRRRR